MVKSSGVCMCGCVIVYLRFVPTTWHRPNILATSYSDRAHNGDICTRQRDPVTQSTAATSCTFAITHTHTHTRSRSRSVSVLIVGGENDIIHVCISEFNLIYSVVWWIWLDNTVACVCVLNESNLTVANNSYALACVSVCVYVRAPSVRAYIDLHFNNNSYQSNVFFSFFFLLPAMNVF